MRNRAVPFRALFRNDNYKSTLTVPRISVRSSSNSSQRYEDESFSWARKHPAAGRSCLVVPRSSPVTTPSFHTLEEYLNWRSWEFGVETPQEKIWGQRLVSHVLSAPLTLAAYTGNVTRWCCVGARAEATLPHAYWKEFLVARGKQSRIDWKLDFIGPDISKIQAQTLTWEGSSLNLRWHHPGYLHDMENPPASEGFVLFNPGLGHSNLAEGWRPTIEYLIEKNAQIILLTAHSEYDAERDALVLKDHLGMNVEYKKNPFASRITYEDPFSKGHLVSPNQYILEIHSRS